MRFSQASKKKNDLVLNMRTSMMMLAAMTARSAVMFIARITLSTTYPAPASDLLLKNAISTSDRQRERVFVMVKDWLGIDPDPEQIDVSGSQDVDLNFALIDRMLTCVMIDRLIWSGKARKIE